RVVARSASVGRSLARPQSARTALTPVPSPNVGRGELRAGGGREAGAPGSGSARHGDDDGDQRAETGGSGRYSDGGIAADALAQRDDQHDGRNGQQPEEYMRPWDEVGVPDEENDPHNDLDAEQGVGGAGQPGRETL